MLVVVVVAMTILLRDLSKLNQRRTKLTSFPLQIHYFFQVPVAQKMDLFTLSSG